MGKTAKKVILCAVLILATACAAIPLSTWLHLLLKGEYSGPNQLTVAACLDGLASDEQHRMVYLLLVLVVVMLAVALWMMGRGGDNFESETVQLTEKIRTPVGIGQGQHGTTRWLKKQEMEKLFPTLEITPGDKRIAALRKEAGREQALLFRKEGDAVETYTDTR